MKVPRRPLPILGAVLATIMGMVPLTALASFTLVPPSETYQGQTYSSLAAAWWQWAAAVPDSASPVADTTGKHCHVKQSGSIWFLAGTTGGEPAFRDCKIPPNRAIFFPIVNNECSTLEPLLCGPSTADRLASAESLINEVTIAEATVDGVQLPIDSQFRVQSPLDFPIRWAPHNVFGVTAGRGVAVADGYWVLLAPLPPGHHQLSFHGRIVDPAFTFDTSVTYNLTVKG
jgi:hypothetical protein